ncbi:hypothetical protein EK21DRAFT_86062 [Setomelanomma holmii]|uniref:Uncharacterized protein n=1 Tax=Setomelanomma holmii TaxID=210430 RepID=A0A9P4LNJ6_9PLEO|nr:hypothetical protein EK21DRAFT_86062 [Setomelanomma holmii]
MERSPYTSQSAAWWRNLCGGVIMLGSESESFCRRVGALDLPMYLKSELDLSTFADCVCIDPEVEHFRNATDVVRAGRCFVITRRGYIGWAPVGSMTGDHVMILPAGRVPYVMRSVLSNDQKDVRSEVGGSELIDLQEERIYKFLGDAYVHGIMHSEGYDEARLEGMKIV